MAAMTAMPTHADTHPFLPIRHVRAHSVDEAHHLVAGHAGILNAGNRAHDRQHVAVTNTAGLHLDAHLPRLRLRHVALDNFKSGIGFRNLRNFHGGSPW